MSGQDRAHWYAAYEAVTQRDAVIAWDTRPRKKGED